MYLWLKQPVFGPRGLGSPNKRAQTIQHMATRQLMTFFFRSGWREKCYWKRAFCKAVTLMAIYPNNHLFWMPSLPSQDKTMARSLFNVEGQIAIEQGHVFLWFSISLSLSLSFSLSLSLSLCLSLSLSLSRPLQLHRIIIYIRHICAMLSGTW